MVSRLMLNLRIAADERFARPGGTETLTPQQRSRSFSAKKNFEDTMIGNLGEDISSWTDDITEDAGKQDTDGIELTECFAIHNTNL